MKVIAANGFVMILVVGNNRKQCDLFGTWAVTPKDAMGLGRVVLSVGAENLGSVNGIEIFHRVRLEPWVIWVFGEMSKRLFDLLDQACARPSALKLFELRLGGTEKQKLKVFRRHGRAIFSGFS